ncbi:hypothetical protein ACFWBS_01310 [Streptomyces mirabilis]|uniref:hypothetical protein n=1 Tax=Streptomyces mirabilis TaxID=68239 RepID=UPI0036664A76
MGLSNPSSCVADREYVWPSFRICAAASWRTFSLSAASAASSLVDLLLTAAASGSLCAARAASRLAWALLVSRGMDACAVAIAPEASPSHFAAPSLKSPRRRAELARSPLHVRNASAPSPFHSTYCGRTLSSSAILRISLAAAISQSAAPCTVPAFAWSSHASICS